MSTVRQAMKTRTARGRGNMRPLPNIPLTQATKRDRAARGRGRPQKCTEKGISVPAPKKRQFVSFL